MTGMLRQGDVLLRPIDAIPPRAGRVPRDRRGRLVLAAGEATGHAHVVEGEAVLVEDPLESFGGTRYLRVTAQARLVHEEHAALTIAPGSYEVVHQREYTGEGFRDVLD